MKLEAQVIDLVDQSYQGRKGDVKQMAYILQDVGAQPTSQYFEWVQTPANSEVKVGQRVNLHVSGFTAVFAGRPRITAKVVLAVK